MTMVGPRWIGALLVSLSGLTLAAFFFRAGSVEEAAPKRVPPAAAGEVRSADLEAIPAVETAAARPDEPAPRAVARALHRTAREEGYREAKEATWEGTLSGQVLSPEGPVANMTVRVEWVLALEPDREEIARLKRAGARRDKDGAWWAKAFAMTDESGCFQIDGLPAVPLRVHAGNTTLQAQLGGIAQIRTERP